MDQNIDPALDPAQARPATVNNGHTKPLGIQQRPSLSTQQSGPTSPGNLSPRVAPYQQRFSTSPSQRAPPSPLPLHRSASSISLDRRSASPVPTRKTSTSSLRNGAEGQNTPKGLSSRRSSRNLLSSPVNSDSKGLPPLDTPREEPRPLTAARVAMEFFEKELAAHHDPGSKSNTIVILHDACYGHRYSRPKTTKTTLSMIVERPERVHAGIMGISAAYVRLGERHEGGAYAPHPARGASKQFPFQIRRTSRMLSLTSPAVTAVHGSAWMHELDGMCQSAETKLATTGKELVRDAVPTAPGQPAKAKLHEGDLYLCKDSLDAFQGALGGVCDGVDAVFEGAKSGRGPTTAFVCVRPPGHHCSADYPSGFCWLNNVHVGIQHAAQSHGLTHAVILDFDLHHGDGSQSITWDHNEKVQHLPKNAPISKKTNIAYFSLHDINSYPCEDGDTEKIQNASLCIENAHNQCIWNVHLQPWKDEDEFWELYESKYSVLLEKARTFLRLHAARFKSATNLPQPKAAIFLSSGFDASEWESAGMQRHKVNVPTSFYARFTRDVVQLSKEVDTAVDGRIVSVLEGGYSNRALMSGVFSHLSGLCTTPLVKQEPSDERGLAYDMAGRLGALSINGQSSTDTKPTELPSYDTSWWHHSALSALEAVAQPPPPPPKKTKPVAPANYSSLTQSFTAKVVDPSKVRTMSGQYRAATPSREQTPPPPEVDWTIAVHELSKLLIPTDRQTFSCRPEELAEVRVKKERQSIAVMPSVERSTGGRQLRDRKAKAPIFEEIPPPTARSVSRSERRKTIADVPLSADPTSGESAEPVTSTTERRRLSVASSVGSVNGITPGIPSSAASSRASSVKPPSNELQNKKSRPSVASRAEPKPRAGPARPAAQRAPSSATNGKVRVNRVEPGPTQAMKEDVKPGADSKPSDAKDVSVDQLAGLIKKIKINVPTDEEYAEIQRKKAEEAEKKKTTTKPTSRKVPASKATKPTLAKKGPTSAAKAAVLPSTGIVEEPSNRASTAPEVTNVLQPVLPNGEVQHRAPVPPLPAIADAPVVSAPAPIDPAIVGEVVVPVPVAPANRADFVPNVPLPVTSPPRPDTPPPPPPAETPMFISYNPPAPAGSPPGSLPPGGVADAAARGDWSAPAKVDTNAQPLQWMPVNADVQGWTGDSAPTKSAEPKKSGLPVFTATGVIPFAPVEPVHSVAPPVPPPAFASAGPGIESGSSQEVKGIKEAAPGGTNAAEKDMWEVPDTPGK